MTRTAEAVSLVVFAAALAAPAAAQRISLSKAIPGHLVVDATGRPQRVTVVGVNFENAGHSNRDEWMHWQIRRDDGGWQRCGRGTPDCANPSFSTDMEDLEISGRFLSRAGFVELRVFRGLADAASTDPYEAGSLTRGWSNVLRIPVLPPAAPPAPTRTATPTPTPTKKPLLVGKPGLSGPAQQAGGLAPQAGAAFAVPKAQAAVPGACLRGFVWREAVPGDHVCVTPQERAAAAEQNRLGPSRTAR